MGTDIHGVFQAHDAATGWHDVPSEYTQDRHYQLFAILAGVRNGIGFAGVKTGEAVKPISPPRGLPADFLVDTFDNHPLPSLDHMDLRRRAFHEDTEALEVWMGDHSHSWLEGDEMARWYAAAPRVVKTGVLSRAAYEEWSGTGNPVSWAGAVFGHDVVVVNDNDVEKQATPNWTYIRCEWDVGLSEELAYFFSEVARLMAQHGRIRFVFGFDS